MTQPLWLAKAWRIRAVVLTMILGLLGLLIQARSTSEGPWLQAMPLLYVAVIGLAIWADWHWLKRNHHRVNEWGLSKGRDARKKPK